MKTTYSLRYAAHPDDARAYDTQRLRRDFLITDLFLPDEVRMVYSMYDRMVVGGAMPLSEELLLEAIDPLKAPFFTSRRELGIFNVGGPGLVYVGDQCFALNYKEALYVGAGDRTVRFAACASGAAPASPSASGSSPSVGSSGSSPSVGSSESSPSVGSSGSSPSVGSSGASPSVGSSGASPSVGTVSGGFAAGEGSPRFYFCSAPAHTAYPCRKVTKADALHAHLGALETSNERTINKMLVREVLPTCQLQMGMTELAPGSVWNTMPAHTHERRMEAYFYFDLPDDQAVCHFMGRPDETRHLWLHTYDAVLSPEWSIHSAAATHAYTFIWAMAGENLDYGDQDFTPIQDLR